MKEKKRSARKACRGWALGLALAVALSACQRADQPVRTVSFLHYFTGSLSSGIEELAQSFNAANPGIRLVPTPLEHESFKTTIRMQLEGPQAPAIFSYWAGEKTRYLVDKDIVASQEALWERGGFRKLFPPAIEAAVSYRGVPYGLPLTQHYIGFFYNAALFKEKGLQEPADWNAFLALCGRLAKDGVTPLALGGKSRWPLQFWFDYLLLRQAGLDYRNQLVEGRTSWYDPPVAAAFRAWASLADAGWFNRDWQELEWDQAAKRVVEGQAAMTLMGTWTIALYREMGKQYPADYGFFSFPSIDPAVGKVGVGPIDLILLSRSAAENPDAAKVLLSLAEARQQIAFNVSAGAIAPNQLVSPEAYPALQQRIKSLIAGLDAWTFAFDLIFPGPVFEAGLDGFVAFQQSRANLPAVLERLEAARKSSLPRP